MLLDMAVPRNIGGGLRDAIGGLQDAKGLRDDAIGGLQDAKGLRDDFIYR